MPVSSTHTIEPVKIRAHLSGKEIKEGKLQALINEHVPVLGDNETLHAACIFVVHRSQVVSSNPNIESSELSI